MNKIIDFAKKWWALIFIAVIFTFLSVNVIQLRVSLRLHMESHSEPIVPITQDEQVPISIPSVDNPSYDDIIALAKRGGTIDFLSIFYSGDDSQYYLTVKYEKEDGTTEINCRRKNSLKDVYDDFYRILIDQGMIKE